MGELAARLRERFAGVGVAAHFGPWLWSLSLYAERS